MKPFIWGLYFDGWFRHFKRFDQLLKYLLDLDRKIVVYAHNGGRFDFLFPEVIEQIPDGNALKIIHGRLAQFRIGELEFRDSLSAVPVGLGKYKKDSFQYWKLKKEHREKYMADIIKYLEADVRNLHELISAFCGQYGPSLTLAGASLKAAIKLEDFEAPKSTAAYFRDLRPFYYGGRVQSLSKGEVKGPLKLWDINSAYPHAMLQDHPWGAKYHLSRYTGGSVPDRSCLELNAESLGAFPEGTMKFGTKFPEDGIRRDFRVTGWEYNAAARLGMLGKRPKIGRIYTFPDKRNFAKYVNHFYNIRKTAPKGSADSLFGKLFMNSLYGRMGLDGSKYEQYMIAPPTWARRLENDGWQLREEAEDGRWIYFRPEPKDKWHFHDIAVAISITGFVRARIFENATLAKRAGSKVHYIDTDGIHTSGPWKPKISNELGDWKREGCDKCKSVQFKAAYYGGKKMYAVQCSGGHWKKAHKGAVLTGEQVKSIAEGKTILFQKESPSMGILSGTRFIQRKIKATN